MTTKITFYIFKNNVSPKEQAIYTCRIIEKAYTDKRKIYIHTADPKEAQNFDTQLWTFRDISFVPHELYTMDIKTEIPVLIGCQHPPTTHYDTLFNLTHEILPFYQQFLHVIEVVPQQEEQKIAARKRYKTYQAAGHAIETFNV